MSLDFIFGTYYLQKGFMGLWGEKVDSIEYYKQQLMDLDKRVSVCFSLITTIFF